MNISIGIAKSEREVTVSTNKSQEELTDLVNRAIENNEPLILDDVKDGRVIIPAKQIAYANIYSPQKTVVGFAS